MWNVLCFRLIWGCFKWQGNAGCKDFSSSLNHIFASNMRQNERFSNFFLQKFSGEGRFTKPPSQTSPFIFSWAPPSNLAPPSILWRFTPLTPTLPLIFWRFAPLIWAMPFNFQIGELQNKFMDLPVGRMAFQCVVTLITGSTAICVHRSRCSIHVWGREARKVGSRGGKLFKSIPADCRFKVQQIFRTRG